MQKNSTINIWADHDVLNINHSWWQRQNSKQTQLYDLRISNRIILSIPHNTIKARWITVVVLLCTISEVQLCEKTLFSQFKVICRHLQVYIKLQRYTQPWKFENCIPIANIFYFLEIFKTFYYLRFLGTQSILVNSALKALGLCRIL